MHPGLSPIYVNPNEAQTNVPPAGDDPGWSLAQQPATTGIPGFGSSEPQAFPRKEAPKKEEHKTKVGPPKS